MQRASVSDTNGKGFACLVGQSDSLHRQLEKSALGGLRLHLYSLTYYNIARFRLNCKLFLQEYSTDYLSYSLAM